MPETSARIGMASCMNRRDFYNRSHLSPESFSSGQGGAGIRRDGADGYIVVGQEPFHVFDTTFRSAESVLHCEGKS